MLEIWGTFFAGALVMFVVMRLWPHFARGVVRGIDDDSGPRDP